jgi:hypothetical protein
MGSRIELLHLAPRCAALSALQDQIETAGSLDRARGLPLRRHYAQSNMAVGKEPLYSS